MTITKKLKIPIIAKPLHSVLCSESGIKIILTKYIYNKIGNI